MATKLNQIIAVEKGIKSRSYQDLTEAHHALQKQTLLAGIARTYRPRDEEGEQLPPESTKVQVKAQDIIRQTVSFQLRQEIQYFTDAPTCPRQYTCCMVIISSPYYRRQQPCNVNPYHPPFGSPNPTSRPATAC